MGWAGIDKIKAKVAHEKESYRLAGEYLKDIKRTNPELWEKKGGKR